MILAPKFYQQSVSLILLNIGYTPEMELGLICETNNTWEFWKVFETIQHNNNNNHKLGGL